MVQVHDVLPTIELCACLTNFIMSMRGRGKPEAWLCGTRRQLDDEWFIPLVRQMNKDTQPRKKGRFM